MSDAALVIWISCGSLLVSAGSLVVSVAAYRRADTLRRHDRQSELSRDIADLRPRLAQLERTIPKAVSLCPLHQPPSHGSRADAAAVHEPAGQVAGAASIPSALTMSYETKSVTARGRTDSSAWHYMERGDARGDPQSVRRSLPASCNFAGTAAFRSFGALANRHRPAT